MHSWVVGLRLEGSLVRVNVLMCVASNFVALITLMVICANCIIIFYSVCFVLFAFVLFIYVFLC